MSKERFRYEAARLRKLYYKITGRYLHMDVARTHYYGRPILGKTEGNSLIAGLITGGSPFMATRFGSVELACVRNHIDNMFHGKTIFRDKTRRTMANNAGFFPPTDRMLERFSRLMLEDMREIDVLGTWNNNLEDYVVKRYCPDSINLTTLAAIEPFFCDIPWSSGLAHKKVLVIHPYKETIIRQYARRELLFPGTAILPEFELKAIRSVQSIAGAPTGFADWFEALDSMREEIAKTDFDIALIGAGAYGFPLAAFVKRLGRQVVHMGGSLQLLFGIMGKRWDDREHSTAYYNQYWVRPDSSETPQHAEKVEGGCYW
ncbi:MAG: hypothetical protein HZA20_07660 [Nitrospirae bacterium]|nr:hypothetical protein [Nitrospirota bacterium]